MCEKHKPGTKQASNQTATTILLVTVIRTRFLEVVVVLEGQGKVTQVEMTGAISSKWDYTNKVAR